MLVSKADLFVREVLALAAQVAGFAENDLWMKKGGNRSLVMRLVVYEVVHPCSRLCHGHG